MNNIVVYNIIKKMDEKIEKEMAETEEVVKHGYQCLRERCWLGKTGQCGRNGKRWRAECDWVL